MNLNKPSWAAAGIAAFLTITSEGSIKILVAALLFAAVAIQLRRWGL